MEFLVRLTDKVNTQVICTSPAHKERVVFDDPTDAAACPECKSTAYLYRKNNAVTKKGHFITYKPDGWSWGSNELKHYGIIKIDCTEAEAAEWCSGDDVFPRKRKFDFDTALTKTDADVWKDENVDSKIVAITKTAAIATLEVANGLTSR